jgi:predicted 3-demethylubiquinone-9 3-methyltransferase (glyoxalase superfamily)
MRQKLMVALPALHKNRGLAGGRVKRMIRQKITPFLWYDHEAEEAANFYVSVFSRWHRQNSAVISITRYGKAGAAASGRPEGSVMTVEFKLAGQKFTALNGGPPFKLSEALSLAINCDTQEEVDYYWEKLSDGGDPEAQICGWLKDKFGLSWQVVPNILIEYLKDPDPVKSERVMQAMLGMKKMAIAALKRAKAGEGPTA